MAGFLSKSFMRVLVLSALSQLLLVSGARKRMSVEKHQAKRAAGTPEDTPDVFGAVGTEDELLAEEDMDRSTLKKPYVAEEHDLGSLGFDALLAHHKAHSEEDTPGPEAGSAKVDKDSPPATEVSEDIDEDNVNEIDDAEGTPSNLDDSTLENEKGDVSLDDVEDEEDKQLPVVTETENVPEVITSVPEVSPEHENDDLDDEGTAEQLPEVTDNNPELENDEESDEHLPVVTETIPDTQGNEDMENDEESDLPVVTDTIPELTPNTECGHQDAPHVFHTITIGGFPDMIGGYNRSSLNGDYAEVACDAISGRETYWKGKAGPLLFYCKSQNVWLVSMPEYLPQAREENCIGFARGSIGKDILAPELMPFNRTYNHEISGWQNLTEVAVTAFTVQDSP